MAWVWKADPKAIEAARRRIDPVFLGTPLRRSLELDRRFDAELIFKDETVNPIRSFKGRGACNLVAQLEEDGADARIAEGAGTIALEAGEQAGPFDLVLAPMGNGALAAGLGSWTKARH